MKLQSQLRSPSVSVQDLIGYVQDQQGPVPSYLALAELSRRKELSAGGAQKAPAPTESVAQQEVAQADPGIASLPLQDPAMFSEQSMAAGGIVAFSGEDGSDVRANPYGLTNYLADMQLPDAPKLDRAAYVGAAPSLADAQKQRTAAYETSGINSLLYDEVADSVKERVKGIDKEKEDAVANAMIMAGLGIAAGRSQNALTNIAEGAMPAMKGYNADKIRLADKADRLSDRQFAISEAKNKFLQTGADSDLRRVQDLENDHRAAERDFTKLDAQQQEKYADKKFQLEKDIKAVDADILSKTIDFDLKKDGLSIQKMNAQTQRMAAEKPELFTELYSNLKSSDAYTKADGKEKNRMLAEAVVAAHPTNTGANDSTLRTKALDITSKYFEAGGAGSKQYKELLKSNPAAATKLYNDYFAQQLALAKATLGSAPTGMLQYDPTTGTIK
jgi:hypothetical protein